MEFGRGWLNDGGSGEESTIAAQMASARGLRNLRGGVRIGLASGIGGVSGALEGRLCDAGCVLEGGSRTVAIASSGVGGGKAGSRSRMVLGRRMS